MEYSSGFLPPPPASSGAVLLGGKECDHRRSLHTKHRRPRVGSRLPEASSYESMKDLLSKQSPRSSASSWRSGRDRLRRYASCGYVRAAGARSPGPTRGRDCLGKLRWEVDGCFRILKESLRRAFRRVYDHCFSRGSATAVV